MCCCCFSGDCHRKTGSSWPSSVVQAADEGKEEGSEVQYIVPAEYIALRAYFYSAVLCFVMDSFITQDRNELFESG